MMARLTYVLGFASSTKMKILFSMLTSNLPSLSQTIGIYVLLQPPQLAGMGFKSFWILRGVNFVYNDLEKNKNDKNEL